MAGIQERDAFSNRNSLPTWCSYEEGGWDGNDHRETARVLTAATDDE